MVASLVCFTALAPASLEMITGTVTYRERMALVGNAELIVSLDRFTPGGDQITISETKLKLNGKQVPVPFAVPYLPNAVKAGDKYGIRAEILVGGKTRFESPRHAMVITNGQKNVAITLVGASQNKNMTIQDQEWKLFWMEGKAIPTDYGISLFLSKDGRMSGSGGVNRFTGKYQWSPPMVQFDPGPMTLKAGSDEQMEREKRFLTVLLRANKATWEEGEMVLYRGEQPLARFKR